MHPPHPWLGLLRTKLLPPPRREKQVIRPRLLEKLDSARNHPLTLVCAPAGYGKTCLLSQWIDRRAGPAGWLSLDRSDNDPAQFFRYFLAALQGVDPEVGAQIAGTLQPPQPLPLQAVGIALVNDLAASEREFVVVLDDYQEVEARAVHDFLEKIIERAPGNLHLVFASRADPPLNLPQLRARGQLLELRAADLCFDGEDARSFFQEVVGLPLSEGEVESLVQKAEGWVAGLQIAGIVLRSQADLPRAVRTFAGSHRHVLDYLAGEVIERLPASTQDFLCQTALLDDLEASLCEAVTGRSDSRQMLERLDRENLFVVSLDAERRWYRYHRLMAEALRRRSEDLDRRQLAELHRRASAWYAGQGMIEAAVGHAFESGELERAAALIEDGAEAMLKRSQFVTLLEWLGRLGEEQLRARPRLNMAYAWALLLRGGSILAVREKLETAVAQAEGTPAAAESAVIRALLATLSGEVAQGAAHARRALEELPTGQTFLRSVAAANLGMAHVMLGEVEGAIRAFEASIALARDSGNLLFAVASSCNLGGLYLLQGHLRLAEAVYRQALELATTKQGRRLPVACRALMGLSEIAREWNDLRRARALLEEAVQLAQQYNETSQLLMDLSLARVLQAQGESEKALDLLQKARGIAIRSGDSAIDDRLVEVTLARLWLQQGSLRGAAEWAARRGFERAAPGGAIPGESPSAVPVDLREAEWLVYARLQLAQKQAAAALEILAALLAGAEKTGRTRRLHEILVLMALAEQEAGSIERAVDALARSLELAEPENFTRSYVDEGLPMAGLLRQAARRGMRKPYCERLLGAFREEEPPPARPSAGGQAGLAEELSGRELEVLQLLAEGRTNREIGERLYISLSTVKGHISSINGKLFARNRTEAVARARQAGILPGD